MIKPLYTPKKEPMRVACFMSGSGTNVRKIIEKQLKLGKNTPFRVALIFTNNKASNAEKIAAEYGIPFFGNDIREYYAKKGAELKDMKVRKEYDSETRKIMERERIDAVALCGYMSITTGEITDNYVTVNVHPADLRVKDKNGRRAYAGMLGVPSVIAAIKNGERSLRSTVHLVNSGLDEGPIMMVSGPVPVSIIEREKKDASLLKAAAERNMEELKEKGDWKILPETIEMLARGRFSADEKGNLYLDGKAILNGMELG